MRRLRELTSLCAIALIGCSDASPDLNGGDPLFVDPCQPGAAYGGSGWGDLYACYFGPTGVANCAGQSICHGGADQTGAVASNGFVCGPTKDSCWQGMTTLVANAATDPTGTRLYAALRRSDGTGLNMPYDSTFTFTNDDTARIVAWLKRGAPND